MSRLELLPSGGQMYIYKLGTECDGAQTRASDVYIPTLVALLVLCFDPSECFWDLRIWSGVVGNKSGKLRYMSQIVTEFPDERSNALFVLSYMKGGSAGPWATQKINSILFDAQEVTWARFVEELNNIFADLNCQATVRRKLATLRQGDSLVEELI